MEEDTNKENTVDSTEAKEPQEEKITIGSLVKYLTTATDQTATIMDELLVRFTGVTDLPTEKEQTTPPVGILNECVSLADKLLTIRNKAQMLKDLIS
jgi:hypothetical protein